MANRKIKTLSFTPEQASFISFCVDSGRYQSASEVVRAGLRLLEDQETRREAELARVRALIQTGADQLDRGEVIDAETLIQSLRGTLHGARLDEEDYRRHLEEKYL